MTTANANLVFETNAERVAREVGDLDGAIDRLGASLDQTEKQAREADRAIEGVGRTSGTATTSLGKLAGGLLTAELAKRALTGAARGLISAFNEYAASADNGVAATNLLTQSADDLKQAFAEAVFGGGNFERTTVLLNQTLETTTGILTILTPLIQQGVGREFAKLGETIQGVNTIFGAFNTNAGALTTTFVAITDLVSPLDLFTGSAAQLGNVIRGDSTAYEGFRDFVFDISAAERVFPSLATGIDEVSTALNNVPEQSPTSGLGWVVSLLDSMEPATERASSGSRSISSDLDVLGQKALNAEAAIKALNAGLIGIQGTTGNGSSQGYQDLFAGFQEEQAALAAYAQSARENELIAIEAQNLKIKQLNEAAYAAETAALEARKAKIESFIDPMKDAGLEIAEGLGAAIMSGDWEGFGKKALKATGQLIKATGQAAIAQGTIISLADPLTGGLPNPARGGAVIGAGVAAVVLGGALGAVGGGGRAGRSSSTPVPQATTPAVNQTYNVNTNVGMVGDPRQFGREVQVANERARRQGL